MNTNRNGGHCWSSAAVTKTPHKHSDYNSTANHLDSMAKLYAAKKPLTELAAELAVSMKGKLPDEPIQAGKLYQLSGTQVCGVDALSLLIIPNTRAIVIDLSTGTVASVNKDGVKSTALIGSRQ